jgi:hypothetical protein
MMKVKGTSLEFCGDFQSRDDVEGDGSEGRSGWFSVDDTPEESSRYIYWT